MIILFYLIVLNLFLTKILLHDIMLANILVGDFMFKKSISIFFIILFFLFFFISIFLNQGETFAGYTAEYIQNNSFHYNENSIFSWPIFGYYNISSYFGYRNSPTNGASSYHSGIDIPAPEGTNIYSICDGKVIYTGFYGADGYTIIIQNNNYQIIYGHVSPEFLVSKNQIINENEKIGTIGPKYVSEDSESTYIDSSGRKTNGATTGCHLHLSIKKDGKVINPLDYL